MHGNLCLVPDDGSIISVVSGEKEEESLKRRGTTVEFRKPLLLLCVGQILPAASCVHPGLGCIQKGGTAT